MKINDIKKAYDSVSANDELREKVLMRIAAENDLADDNEEYETSQIEIIPKGGSRHMFAAICTAAATIAAVFIISRAVFNVDVIDEGEVTETTSVAEELPENTALVTLKVLDENGEPVKNVRIDYLPMIFTHEDEPAMPGSDWYTSFTDFDMENIENAGTIPMTYGKDIELAIAYGEYDFYMSTAMPNSQYRMVDMDGQATILYYDGSMRTSNMVLVDENTTEIVLSCFDPVDEYQYSYPKLGVILRGADGRILTDYTVILKPKDGVMQEGYNDVYGGYVLTRTNENGEAFWRNTPIEGEYEVIAYKEELHPISEPIKEPFVFGDDNSIKYTKNDNVYIYEKTFTQAE